MNILKRFRNFLRPPTPPNPNPLGQPVIHFQSRFISCADALPDYGQVVLVLIGRDRKLPDSLCGGMGEYRDLANEYVYALAKRSRRVCDVDPKNNHGVPVQETWETAGFENEMVHATKGICAWRPL